MTRLLLIGAAGLDWPGFNARLDAGQAPALTALARRGGAAWLRGWPPFDGPAPWVTLLTGRTPEAHGVWRGEEPWAGGLRPVSRASWRTAPVWETLAAAGVSVGSVAWPAARPGAAWTGVHIDRDFATATGPDHAGWALPLDCAPADAREALRPLRVHPSDITAAMLAPLVPTLADLDQSRDAALPLLAVAMAQAASVQAGAAWLLQTARPQAAFVHHEWLGRVSAAFEGRPPPFEHVMDAAWRFFDGLVGRLSELAGPDTLVMVVSPGWRDRPGVLIAAGPGVTRDSLAEGAEAVDMAPTVLAAFGLEDASLPGTPIAGLAPPGPCAAAPVIAASPAPSPDAELLAEAVASGYAAPPPAPTGWWTQGLAELALTLMLREPRAALAAADAALAQDPGHALALDAKAMAHVILEEPEPLPDLAKALARRAPRRGWSDLARAAYLVLTDQPSEAVAHIRAAERDRDPAFLARVAAVWFAAGRPDEAARVFGELLEMDPANAAARVGLGAAAAARRDFRTAEDALLAAVRLDPGRRPAWAQLAEIYRRTGRPGEAARAARFAESGAPPRRAG
jgi:hypothetical protein